ncbi:hypothetical protein QR680_003879 [Steinernema hermaphroditum]|uniref:Uncharacterized protein n=1 Tax=Steinernema hermaphroditum TaxID=289476 RepID=A0AA39LSB3_9BILA|nr:hypothetical protein QR680_003879 [Steinernema hermaphroditum]
MIHTAAFLVVLLFAQVCAIDKAGSLQLLNLVTALESSVLDANKQIGGWKEWVLHNFESREHEMHRFSYIPRQLIEQDLKTYDGFNEGFKAVSGAPLQIQCAFYFFARPYISYNHHTTLQQQQYKRRIRECVRNRVDELDSFRWPKEYPLYYLVGPFNDRGYLDFLEREVFQSSDVRCNFYRERREDIAQAFGKAAEVRQKMMHIFCLADQAARKMYKNSKNHIDAELYPLASHTPGINVTHQFSKSNSTRQPSGSLLSDDVRGKSPADTSLMLPKEFINVDYSKIVCLITGVALIFGVLLVVFTCSVVFLLEYVQRKNDMKRAEEEKKWRRRNVPMVAKAQQDTPMVAKAQQDAPTVAKAQQSIAPCSGIPKKPSSSFAYSSIRK